MTPDIVLLVIDMQEGLARPQSDQDPRTRLLSTIKVLVQQARFHQIPIGYIWTPSAHGSDYFTPVVDRPPRSGEMLGDSGILTELPVLPKDFVIAKPAWSAFNNTGLPFHLASLRTQTVILTGIATNLSIESTARDAYDRRFNVITVSDAMLGSSRDEHIFAVTRIFPRISRVMTSTQVINWLPHLKGGSRHE